jgi:hypothetical protein
MISSKIKDRYENDNENDNGEDVVMESGSLDESMLNEILSNDNIENIQSNSNYIIDMHKYLASLSEESNGGFILNGDINNVEMSP